MPAFLPTVLRPRRVPRPIALLACSLFAAGSDAAAAAPPEETETTLDENDLVSALPGQPGVGVQVGSQSSLGVEAALSLAPWQGWRIDANVALLHAQYDDFAQMVTGRVVSFAGNQPIDVPERVANLWVSWAFAPRWEARAGLQHVGTMFGEFANAVRRPDYTLLNAGLDHQVDPASRLSRRLYNLTDAVYAPARGGNATSWLLGPPRSVELTYAIVF